MGLTILFSEYSLQIKRKIQIQCFAKLQGQKGRQIGVVKILVDICKIVLNLILDIHVMINDSCQKEGIH